MKNGIPFHGVGFHKTLFIESLACRDVVSNSGIQKPSTSSLVLRWQISYFQELRREAGFEIEMEERMMSRSRGSESLCSTAMASSVANTFGDGSSRKKRKK